MKYTEYMNEVSSYYGNPPSPRIAQFVLEFITDEFKEDGELDRFFRTLTANYSTKWNKYPDEALHREIKEQHWKKQASGKVVMNIQLSQGDFERALPKALALMKEIQLPTEGELKRIGFTDLEAKREADDEIKRAED